MNLEQEVLLAQGDYRQVILILQTSVIMRYRCGGLMIRALDSKSSCPGLTFGQSHYIVFLGETLTLMLPLHPKCINVYQ